MTLTTELLVFIFTTFLTMRFIFKLLFERGGCLYTEIRATLKLRRSSGQTSDRQNTGGLFAPSARSSVAQVLLSRKRPARRRSQCLKQKSRLSGAPEAMPVLRCPRAVPREVGSRGPQESAQAFDFRVTLSRDAMTVDGGTIPSLPWPEQHDGRPATDYGQEACDPPAQSVLPSSALQGLGQ